LGCINGCLLEISFWFCWIVATGDWEIVTSVMFFVSVRGISFCIFCRVDEGRVSEHCHEGTSIKPNLEALTSSKWFQRMK